MPKSQGQKLRMLYLQKILIEQTDEHHTMTVTQMIEELGRCGITAERKTIYDDLELLRTFGIDLVCNKSKTCDYYVASRLFELPELKLLADAVACSKFITEKKSNLLIKKIDSLASRYDAGQIARQVVVQNRVKTINEQIYYNVDTIHNAITQKKQISFDYFDLDINKKKQYREGRRLVSPYSLSWDDENYYLIGFYEKYNKIVHLRVDKMENILITAEKNLPQPQHFQLADYSKKIFSMFGGEEQEVTLQFENNLVGVVFDKFGKDTHVHKTDDTHFSVCVKIAVSSSFYGWLFQFGRKAQIIAPPLVKEEFIQMAADVCNLK